MVLQTLRVHPRLLPMAGRCGCAGHHDDFHNSSLAQKLLVAWDRSCSTRLTDESSAGSDARVTIGHKDDEGFDARGKRRSRKGETGAPDIPKSGRRRRG